ncbi:MAG: HEAT repeat domain-containing protein, partial [Alphaproteobacteria bacterium]|nr:HEAT repeat domain-containing protein [Alphaproteobacteria bacterium]
CWRELETLCEEGKDKQYSNEVNLGYGRQIVEALSRYGDECEEKVHDVLKQKIEDYTDNPMKWLEPLVVRLAGEMQLDSAVPLLIAKLIEDGGDLMNQECARALSQIGTSAVLGAVSEAYATAPHNFRLYATTPLENIHSDLAVETCLNLIRQENDADVRGDLAHALLSHFSVEGVEVVRQLLLAGTLGRESRDVRSLLLETCTIMGERFPEYDEWKSNRRTEKEEHGQRIEELKDDPAGLMQFALEKLK